MTACIFAATVFCFGYVRAFSFRANRLLSSSNAAMIESLATSRRRVIRFSWHQQIDADELLAGGVRYSMVPLPDSMVSTTLFVGNLNAFVQDEDLSDLFQTCSRLQSLPACVVRKLNFESKKYGFVYFPSQEEKEVRQIRKNCLGIVI
jgi:hypothetical protein